MKTGGRGSYETLPDLLRGRAQQDPDRVAYVFLGEKCGEEGRLTYGALDRGARAVAARLQGEGVAPGQRVLLLYPPGLEYIVGFFGCLYAGAVAVGAYPPRARRSRGRLEAVVADAGARVALSTRAVLEHGGRLPDGSGSTRWLAHEETDDACDSWRPPALSASSLALLQYTSGSTATPRGVMLTHANLLHNEETIARAFGHSEESIVVGWLPFYHDMGLIGNVIQPMYVGGRCVLMSPATFLKRPITWVEAISRYRGTTSGGPNFAYDLCVWRTTPEERAGLDLSCWTLAFNGAEPVRAATLSRFTEAFACTGFRGDAFFPCYGLAEATLLVSGRSGVVLRDGERGAARHGRVDMRASAGDDTRPVVSCGPASSQDQTVVVVDPDLRLPCRPGEVGEIWISSPSVAQGYWKRPEESDRVFGARLANDPSPGPFLRTGDLGYLHGGEVHVTGRLKDLVIVRGRNHHPEDIEWTVQACHPALRGRLGAAFSVEGEDQERVVVVQEVDRGNDAELSAIAAAVREAVAREHEIEVARVALVRPNAVARTSSGKVQRYLCRAQLLNGELRPLLDGPTGGAATAAPPDPDAESPMTVHEWLRHTIARMGGVPVADVKGRQPLTRYGLDSLRAFELSHALEERYGAAVPAGELLDASVDDVLRRLAQPSAGRADAAPPSGPREYPLSVGQRALWVVHRLAPESSAYNLAVAFRVQGLEPERFRRSFERLVQRHAALRTTFREAADGRVWQCERETVSNWLTEQDASSWASERIEEAMAAEARRPFSLDRSPLRVLLLSCGSGLYAVAVVVHHIVSDFWSLRVLLQELEQIYGAGGELPAALARRPPASYSELVEWQSALLAGDAGAELSRYWEARLRTAREPELPEDRERPARSSARGGRCTFRIGAEATARLKALSASRSTTLFTTLAATLQVLLHRHSGADDVVIGTPALGRPRARWARSVGYFVNPILLRGDLAGRPSFEAVLGRTAESVRGALAHADYPFAEVVERVQPERNAGRPPLLRVLLALQTAPVDAGGLASLVDPVKQGPVTFAGLAGESLSLPPCAAQFELRLGISESGPELSAGFDYDPDVFEANTVERLARRFQSLLTAVCVSPETPVGELALLDDAEREEITVGWNDTTRAYVGEETVHDLVAAQVRRTPDAVAVSFEGRTMTYIELEAAANRLARRLRAEGAGPEATVGVCLERSAEMVVALLAVLKAGAAYLPLDPDYPAARLGLMMASARVGLVVSEERLARGLPAHSARVVCIDRDRDAIAHESPGPLPGRVPSPGLAYVIYTSGSTGTPKGVMNTHQGIRNRLLWMQDVGQIQSTDRVLQKTPFSFDVSVWEFFAPLITGARLVVARPGGHRDPMYLAGVIAQERITVVHFVPSMLQAFLDQADPQLCRSLRLVVASGEALGHATARRFSERLSAELHNLYGPTEAAVDVTYHLWRPGRLPASAPVPIGRPIANTRLHVLDRLLQPVPAGVQGELYIGGIGLARGYLHAPHLTAERFIPDPLGQDHGGRLYRTGDLARRLPDGEIEFLGRIDEQVKVRGHRIELGEIAAVLLEAPSVGEAVAVMSTHDGVTQGEIVAYVSPQAGGELNVDELRGHVLRHLPAFMCPAAFVVLPRLPLNPNGKLDRRALPLPGAVGAQRARDLVEPRSVLEAGLARIWAEALGTDRVGVHDDFFALGGNSIMATDIVARLQAAVATDLPLVRLFFENPTIADLARAIEATADDPRHIEELTAALATLPPTAEDMDGAGAERLDSEVQAS